MTYADLAKAERRGRDPRPGHPARRDAHPRAGVEGPGPVRGATERPRPRHRRPPVPLRRRAPGDALRPGPAAPGLRGDPRVDRPLGGEGHGRRRRGPRGVRSSASRRRRRTGPRRRSRRPPGRRPGRRRPRPSRTRRCSSTCARTRSRDEARTDEKGSVETALPEADRVLDGVLPRRLHPARPDGAPRRGGRVERGPPHRLGRLRRALPRAAGPGRGARHPAGARPRDRARHGRGLRREAHRRGRPRGGTPRPRRREARLGAVDPRGGVHLGVLPTGGGDRVSRWPERRGLARGLGLHQHQPRRGGPRDALRHPERPGLLGGLGLSPAPGVLSLPGGHRQQLRPRVVHGRAGGGRRRRPARVPAGSSREPAAAGRPREGREGVRLGGAAEAGDAGAGRRPGLRDGEGLGRGRLRRGGARSLEGRDPRSPRSARPSSAAPS